MAVAYAATAFVVVQVAALTFERLTLPPWTVTLVIVLALLGFPLAVVLAWAYEVTPDGVRRTGSGSEAPADAPAPPVRARTGLGLVAGITILAVGGWWLQYRGNDASAAVERIAVLPLANLMQDSAQRYFVQGMHDGIISELQAAGVPVIARTSVMRFDDGSVPVREIARELNVDAVVEGSVFRADDSVEIDARLIDPVTEEYLWRSSFAGSLRDIIGLHRRLTRAIAEEIQAALDPAEESRLSNASPVDPEAYEAYLKGEFHLQRFSPEDFDVALEHYRRALAIDSTYAPAHLGIARVWSFRAQAVDLTGVTASEAREHWEPALERALTLDSTLVGAHAHLATTSTWAEWRFEEGLEQFSRVLELNPGLARQRMFYSHLLTILGQWEEARRQAERALATDPLNPFIQGLYGTHLTLIRRHEEAIEVLEEMYRRYPGANFGRAMLSNAYEAVGRYEEALRVQKERYRVRGDSEVVAALERGDREGGYREASRRAAEVIAARARDGEGPPGGPWGLYASAGNDERTLHWLEQAVEARNQNMPYIGVGPGFEHLHDEPRFRELTRRIGVPILTDAGLCKFPDSCPEEADPRPSGQSGSD